MRKSCDHWAPSCVFYVGSEKLNARHPTSAATSDLTGPSGRNLPPPREYAAGHPRADATKYWLLGLMGAEPAARRWLVRYVSEGTPSLRDVAKVTASLAKLEK